MCLRLLWHWHSEPNCLLPVCCNFQRPNWGHLRWTDTWSHSADDKLWSCLELDIVIIEGKQALTAVTVAAAEDQQTPQGTLPAVVTCDAYRAVSWGRRTKEREWKLYWQQVTTAIWSIYRVLAKWGQHEQVAWFLLHHMKQLRHHLNCILGIRATTKNYFYYWLIGRFCPPIDSLFSPCMYVK